MSDEVSVIIPGLLLIMRKIVDIIVMLREGSFDFGSLGLGDMFSSLFGGLFDGFEL